LGDAPCRIALYRRTRMVIEIASNSSAFFVAVDFVVGMVQA
jgi:hypothetical protein